jgi:hypothetical protein
MVKIYDNPTIMLVSVLTFHFLEPCHCIAPFEVTELNQEYSIFGN